jgi:hypothetical protein
MLSLKDRQEAKLKRKQAKQAKQKDNEIEIRKFLNKQFPSLQEEFVKTHFEFLEVK